LIVNNPSDLPEPSRLDHVEEPFIKATTKSDLNEMYRNVD
jgi:GTP-binding protein LepA